MPSFYRRLFHGLTFGLAGCIVALPGFHALTTWRPESCGAAGHCLTLDLALLALFSPVFLLPAAVYLPNILRIPFLALMLIVPALPSLGYLQS